MTPYLPGAGEGSGQSRRGALLGPVRIEDTVAQHIEVAASRVRLNDLARSMRIEEGVLERRGSVRAGSGPWLARRLALPDSRKSVLASEESGKIYATFSSVVQIVQDSGGVTPEVRTPRLGNRNSTPTDKTSPIPRQLGASGRKPDLPNLKAFLKHLLSHCGLPGFGVFAVPRRHSRRESTTPGLAGGGTCWCRNGSPPPDAWYAVHDSMKTTRTSHPASAARIASSNSSLPPRRGPRGSGTRR